MKRKCELLKILNETIEQVGKAKVECRDSGKKLLQERFYGMEFAYKKIKEIIEKL